MADIQTIKFLPVPNFPGYRVGDDGSVWSCWRRVGRGGGYANRLTDNWRLLKPSKQRDRSTGRSYFYLNLCRDGRATTFRVHRLVLESFVGPCPDGMETRHLDGDPGNNRLDNLQWGTPEQNHDDCRRHGRYSKMPRNRCYTHDGKTLCLKEWAAFLGVNYHTIYSRTRLRGMPFHEAISKPFLGVAGNGNTNWNKQTMPPTGS